MKTILSIAAIAALLAGLSACQSPTPVSGSASYSKNGTSVSVSGSAVIPAASPAPSAVPAP